MAHCRDPEGWRVISHLRDFDTTPCFEEGIVLSGLLTGVLVLSLLRSLELGFLSFDAERKTPKSLWVLKGKVALLAAGTAVSAANLIHILLNKTSVPVLQYYALEPVALLVIAIFTWFNHTRTRRSSSILLLFWPLYTATHVVWTRTLWLSGDLDHFGTLFALKWMTVGLGLCAFALECLGSEFGLKQIHDAEGDFSESPLLTANIYSRWAFGWMTPLMKKGSEQFITEKDLPSLPPDDSAAALGSKLKDAMKRHSSLWVSLYVAYGGPYVIALILKLAQDSLAFLQPQLLRLLLAYISYYQATQPEPGFGPRESPIQGFALAFLMFAASMLQTVTLNQYFQRCFETGMRVRAGLVTVIYAKALVLSNEEQSRATGDIVNLMSVDATRLQDLCTYGLIAISGALDALLFHIVIAFVSLYHLLGWAAFVGVAIMIISVPLNTFIARILKKMQEQQMKNRDKRTRLMSELLNNIKSIKLYAWENAFLRKILLVRNEQELEMLKKIGIANSLNTTLWGGIPLLVAFSSLATAAVTSSKPLTADIIFPAMSLFMLLQFPLAMFAQVTSNIIEAIVSVRRLSDFLKAEELQGDARKIVEARNLKIGDEVLSIKKADFWWSKKDASPALEDINITVKKGELMGILGRVGAGKTSLLSAIIGNMTRSEGELIISGSVSYAPQNPWILSATVRENIVFSHEYDETFYNLVIEACALTPDLALLPQGDMTEVGEKGITLSGGQRARVSLARAVYARADLILLDDVLAAVDSHVARHVFDRVIGPEGLLSTKARILVTNSISFLRHFDQLAFLRRGIILESGNPRTLIADPETEIGKLVRGHGTLSSNNSSGASTPFTSGSGSTTPKEAVSPTGSNLDFDEYGSLTEKLRHRTSFTKAKIAPPPPPRASSDGISKEHSEQGRVKREVYLRYVEAATKSGFFLYVLATVSQQALSVMANLTLRDWGEHNRAVGGNTGMLKYLLFYGGFSLSSTLLGGVAAITMWVLCTIKSARQLHDSMLNSVLRAPLSFFELTPTGRVLNLFSRDTYVVDQLLGRVIQNLIRTLAVCFSIVVVIGGSFPPFLIAVIPLGWFYTRVMAYYLATSRELKRLDAVSRSPIFAWFSESLAGADTIRAYRQQSIFIANNERRIDRNQLCYLPSISVNRWLAVRLEFVGALIIFVAAMLAMTALITAGVDAGLVGLVLSYALNTTSSLNWVVRSASEVEQNIVSVERMVHYIELPSEGAMEIPEAKPTETWPSEGQVEFREYSTRYRPELDPVLKNISMTIRPKEKLGICGRTGAGKSSLLLALFRIIEPTEGTILIDGIDITKIGLHDLRSAIAIVPQSPDLFEGTLRDNIDPLNEYTDADIWQALTQSHLKEYAEAQPEKLDAPVREGGLSLSSGQRQLLCFARALLRKAKILVLDEATSAVDLDTDRAIQEIIRGPAFADTTIFTIAHRLNTIMEYDRVLVLSNGQISELDTPSKLLEKKDSLFYSLAAEAGLA
ncbi:ATP-binding cassette transporter C [Pleurotus pulmonarius]